MFTLRCIVFSVLVCVAIAQYPHTVYGAHHPIRPFYPGGYGYFPNYHQQSATCSTANPCYDYTMTVTTDGALDFSRGNATHFREHYRLAGFDHAAMIEEGKKAAAFFKKQYGIDVGNLPDDTFLAPAEELSDGLSFNFVTHRNTLYMASKKDHVSFINTPGSAVWWNINFSKDYRSTGTYSGTIPAGARVYFGSLLVNTCPNRGPYPSTRCVFSKNPAGRKFIRLTPVSFQADYQPGPFVLINSVLDDEWGTGQSRGIFIRDPATGVSTGSVVLTFPQTCSAGGCYTGHFYG